MTSTSKKNNLTQKLQVVSYNIHKGMSPLNRKVVTTDIVKSLKARDFDIICLQEVQGRHDKREDKFDDFLAIPQYQLFSDYLNYYHSYGKNPIYEHGHHGNAILSRYPIRTIHNLDLSVNSLENRGMLHAEITVGESKITNSVITVMSAHLNLRKHDRSKQYQRIIDYINKVVEPNQPLILAGDLNDWTQVSNNQLGDKLNMTEVIHNTHGKLKVTFPATYPLLSLDRIYVRNLDILQAQVETGKPWSKLSDHLPVTTELAFEVGKPTQQKVKKLL